eukprot:TRINITY_DN2862_c0_g2_i1.p1 TRINITY_DN2862_c0_g2~~TRINITY_DN2862_c0_g2_i1.p1  ORF type:complete len:221 (+),score=16.56 TRINITY_DN2862_c0_g2_i1:2-664(+)
MLGLILCYCSVILYAQPVTDGLCTGIAWTLSFGTTLVFAIILSTIYRSITIFGNTRSSLLPLFDSSKWLLKIFSTLFIIDVLLLIVLSTVNRPEVVFVQTQSSVIYSECDYNFGVLVALLCFTGVIILAALILSLSSRRTKVTFYYHPQLVLATVVNVAMVFVIVVSLSANLNTPVGRYTLINSGVIFSSTVVLFLMVFWKVYLLLRKSDDQLYQKFREN